ncbi:glycerol-3-phosphate 1-O-acyltransferase PlsY [Metamycoplasma auris]|uniref:Glycerol-3-phosphate acyltransferase n=1 Tax=Metamycoplasma auris TaxID=51363 RepID=A0A2W7GS31_9BACT|nr:glycerol-3-phosphate 1-O-acyltransferase PlsY [Metamycoplasma auris]PZW00583.1 glycerol-3-phosphate acyltransferase PlsY [Metamycoplasma auris]
MFDWRYIWINLLIFIIAYFIGSINISILISKKWNKDIRQHGSHNAGSTNALRVFGFKFAILVFIFDCLKSFIPTMIVFLFKKFLNNGDTKSIIPLFAGLGAFIGHIIPCYFKFKGGKGVASFFGMILAFDLTTFFMLALFYLCLVLITKYVSLTSVISAIVFAFLSFIPYYYNEWVLSFINQNIPLWSHSYILVGCTIIIMLKHIPNYIRLIKKEESRLNLMKFSN